MANDMLKAALELARTGIPVFPCRPACGKLCNEPACQRKGRCTAAKKPLTTNGFKDATTNEDQIETWWALHPNALVGMPTGERSGIAVLDLDYEVDPVTGEVVKDGVRAVKAKGHELPVTRTARTPRGGLHLSFRHEPEFRSTTGKDGIDTRAEGGYVIVAGPGYETTDGSDIVGAPDWVAEIFCSKAGARDKSSERGASGGKHDPETRPEDVRRALAGWWDPDNYDDWQLAAMALHGFPGGLEIWLEWASCSSKFDPDEQIVKWNQSKPTKGITVASILHCVPREVLAQWGREHRAQNSAGDWENPEELTQEVPALPFPLDALPDGVRSAVKEVHAFTQAPVALVAASALSAVSIALQALVDVARASSLKGPPSLFLLTIAGSGERKSKCDSYFTQSIRDYEKEAKTFSAAVLADHAAAKASWDAKVSGLKEAIKKAAKDGKSTEDLDEKLLKLQAEEPVSPLVPRLLYGDATPEALAWGLAKNWPSAGIISPEAGVIFGAHAMGKETVMRTLSQFNVLWDGGDLHFDRRTKESFTVSGARLTLGLSVQAGTLEDFFERTGTLSREIGFLARFLIAWPKSRMGRRLYKDPPAAWPGLYTFNNRLRELLKMTPSNGALHPTTLTLSAAAFEVWRDHHDEVEVELGAHGQWDEVNDAAAKNAENAVRIAACFHAFEQGPAGEIDVGTMVAACKLAAWYLHESLRFFRSRVLDPEYSSAIKLDSWLINHARVSGSRFIERRTIRQLGPNAIRDKRKLEAALGELVSAGRVRINEKKIEVNPRLLGERS